MAGPNRPRGVPRKRDARVPSQVHGDRVKTVPPRGRLPRAAKEKESKLAKELRRELECTLNQMNDLVRILLATYCYWSLYSLPLRSGFYSQISIVAKMHVRFRCHMNHLMNL